MPYCSLVATYTDTTKSSPLMQDLMGILLQFTEMGYYL